MLSNAHHTSQGGTSLIELMIGSALGLIILSALTAFYSQTTRQTHNALAQARFNHDIHTVLHLMERDIRRAGYRAAPPQSLATGPNPFNDPENRVQIAEYRDEQANSCVTFSYDLNNDGKVGVGSAQVAGTFYSNSNQERLGYRLHEGRIQMRTGGKQFDCHSGRWQAITEPAITVTELTFTLTMDCLRLMEADKTCAEGMHASLVRKVDIQLKAHLATEPRVSAALTEAVQIRNQLDHSVTHQASR